MRRVVDALLAGEPVPPDAHAVLTEAERAEVASLARTAHLTKLTLARPEPSAEMEAASLERAHAAFTRRRQADAALGITEEKRTPSSPLLDWLRERLGKGNEPER